MAARSSGSRSERIAREQRELQRVLSAQLSAMWAQYERTGYPARDEDFPAVAAFYWQAEGEFIRRAGSDLAAGGFDVSDELTRVLDYSADGVMRSIEESLRRLGLVDSFKPAWMPK